MYDQNLMNDMIRKLAWDGLQIIIMDGGKMIDKRMGVMLGTGADSMC